MTPLQQLKEDYERRAKTAKDMSKGLNETTDMFKRLTTKASLYREFAIELGNLTPKDSSDWLPIEHNLAKYNYEASKNCKVKFNNGETLRHFQEWPIAEATHFLPVSKESNHE